MKVLVLWPNIPQYIAACLNEIESRGSKLLVIQDVSTNKSNKNFVYEETQNIKVYNCSDDKNNQILNLAIKFNPDIVISSLISSGLRYRILKEFFNKECIKIGAVDAFMHKTKTEFLSSLIFRNYYRKYYDVLFVPGYRGFLYGKSIGFRESRIIEGLYSCDTKLFSKIGKKRSYIRADWPKVFLFIGQYVQRKGILTLLEAYRHYRAEVDDPWQLWFIGDGLLKSNLNGLDGVVDYGYLKQNEIIDLMGNSGALVLPSVEDHWPLVIHEGTCSGLPIIASRNCGSTVELVRNGINGYVHEVNNVASLKNGLKYVSTENPEKLGNASFQMSLKYSVEKWADIVCNFIPKITEYSRT